MKAENKFDWISLYALIFGLLLGLCIWKFGNPVILDQKVTPPRSLLEAWMFAWPPHWVNWLLGPLALAGAALALRLKPRWPGPPWLWWLPLLWLGWQFFSATQTVDNELTAAALGEFGGCVACYFIGAWVVGRKPAIWWLLPGVLVAFTLCLTHAIDQRLFEFPQSRQLLVEGERAGWTNVPPDMLAQMKVDNVVITTNGMAVANPKILDKFAKGRVMGTLVYPNALAGLILLLLPVSLVLAFNGTKRLRPLVHAAAVLVTVSVGGMAFFWTGSKLGWLIAMVMGGVCLFRRSWPARLKWATLMTLAVVGLGIFAVRFHGYFAAGATSVEARFDYWRAAAVTTGNNPLLGTGPGTFQRPYAQIKSPAAEMARLTHNDYLEQFSDSGVIGGLAYAAWIAGLLTVIGRRVWRSSNPVIFAIFLGLLGWFIQGLGEFSLYVPALAWIAFTLSGALLALTGNPFDKKPAPAYPARRT